MNASLALPRRVAAVPRCLVVLLAFSTAAIAQKPAPPFDINLNPGSTAVHWTLNTNIHGDIHGTFKLKSGFLRIDPANGAASGQIVIDATSGESGDASRDKRMHSVVLESSKYPLVTFRPTHVNGKIDFSSPCTVTLDGIMNLHGQDHPVQITVNLRPKDASVSSQAHFTIPFVDWGLKDPSFMMFRTEKVVTLDVEATAVPTPEPPAHAS